MSPKFSSPNYTDSTPTVLDTCQIMQLLPHRYPFLLVDKVIQLDSQTITGIKQVTINEPFFQGHFPQAPIMPGVLQIEALAQVGAILALSTLSTPENYMAYLAKVDQCKFRRKVVPGDTLVLQGEVLTGIKRGLAKMQGRIFVNNQLTCEATILAQLVRQG